MFDEGNEQRTSSSTVRVRHRPGSSSQRQRVQADVAQAGIIVPARRSSTETRETEPHQAVRQAYRINEPRTQAYEPPPKTRRASKTAQPRSLAAQGTRDYDSAAIRRASLSALPTTRQSRYDRANEPRERGQHTILSIGIGMILIIVLWFILVHVCAFAMNHFIDRWQHGPANSTMYIGVFGHADSQQHPTVLLATNYRGQVLLYEEPGGDPSKMKVYIGPDLNQIQGWTGDTASAIVDIEQVGRNVQLTILGSNLGWDFNRFPAIKWHLTNTGDSFKSPTP